MLRSLYRKLVLILVLLIVSLMFVVGAFLISGIMGFYTREFTSQMTEVWGRNPEFTRALVDASKSPSAMADVLEAYTGALGIDSRRRNYYILDGRTGDVLLSSDSQGRQPDLTPNVRAALLGKNGSAIRSADSYFDVAVPIGDYIVYIYDNKESLGAQTNEMFMIILESVIFGLCISILLSLLLSKTMTTPLESLTKGAKRIASGDFSHMPQVTSTDEIGVLTQTFNNMARVLKDTLEAVGSERDKLGTLFLHMTDGVAAFAPDKTLMHMNPAAERMLDVTYRETLTFEELFGAVSDWADICALHPPDYLETQITRMGRTLNLFFAVFGVAGIESTDSANDAGYGVLAVVHDITEQRRLEEVRREFVSNVSHELRTPLTNIKSYAETLCEDAELPPETVQSFSQVIVGEADRMTRIVRDLLTLSKFDYGKIDWNMGSFSIKEAVLAIYDANLLEARRHKHNMTVEVARIPPAMWGDRDRVEQVIANIVANAINYTPDGGVIEIKLDVREENAVITVKDNGIGIPPEALPRIFERFYRVDKHRSRSSGGTGLGLAIAGEIIQTLGGRIDIDSTPNEGTAVTIALPLERRPS